MQGNNAKTDFVHLDKISSNFSIFSIFSKWPKESLCSKCWHQGALQWIPESSSQCLQALFCIANAADLLVLWAWKINNLYILCVLGSELRFPNPCRYWGQYIQYWGPLRDHKTVRKGVQWSKNPSEIGKYLYPNPCMQSKVIKLYLCNTWLPSNSVTCVNCVTIAF